MQRMPSMHGHDPSSYPFPPGPPPMAPVPGMPQPLNGFGYVDAGFSPGFAEEKPLPKWAIPVAIGGVLVLFGGFLYLAVKSAKAREERLTRIAEKEGSDKALAYEAGETGLAMLRSMTMNKKRKAKAKVKAAQKKALKATTGYLDAKPNKRKKAKKNEAAPADAKHQAELAKTPPPTRKPRKTKKEKEAVAALVAATEPTTTAPTTASA